MIGISIKPTIGIGDALQFSSLPENYFKATGKRLYDVSRPWFFDYNPYVERELSEKLEKSIEMWNFSPKHWDWPKPRTEGVYLCNSEIWAHVLGVKEPTLNRPRLYRFENEIAFSRRNTILFQTQGKSHGTMPAHIIKHVIDKYYRNGFGNLYHIGPDKIETIPHIDTKTLWDLSYVISQSRLLIGLDSGPLWIGACYPDVVCKKVRTKPTPEHFKTWVPLAMDNIHSHWDDRCHQIFNPTEDDIGFTSSYKKI